MELFDEDPKSWVILLDEESCRNALHGFSSDDRIPYEALGAR